MGDSQRESRGFQAETPVPPHFVLHLRSLVVEAQTMCGLSEQHVDHVVNRPDLATCSICLHRERERERHSRDQAATDEAASRNIWTHLVESSNARNALCGVLNLQSNAYYTDKRDLITCQSCITLSISTIRHRTARVVSGATWTSCGKVDSGRAHAGPTLQSCLNESDVNCPACLAKPRVTLSWVCPAGEGHKLGDENCITCGAPLDLVPQVPAPDPKRVPFHQMPTGDTSYERKLIGYVEHLIAAQGLKSFTFSDGHVWKLAPQPPSTLIGAKITGEGHDPTGIVHWFEFDNGWRLTFTVDFKAAPHDCFWERVAGD